MKWVHDLTLLEKIMNPVAEANIIFEEIFYTILKKPLIL